MAVHDLVMTPYGQVPCSETVAINRHQTVKVVDGRLRVFDLLTDEMLGDFGSVPSGGIPTDPYAYAAQLRGEEETSTPPWWASDDSITAVLKFSATWRVPSIASGPESDGFFSLWNGLDDGALQPVLEWNNGFGKHYGIRNWAFISGKYVYGDLVKVEPGTLLTGNVQYRGMGSTRGYMYTLSFDGYPAADFTVWRSREQGEAKGVCLCFESYHHSRPPDQMVAFTHIRLQQRWSNPTPPNINWTAGKRWVVVNSSSSDGELDYYWDPPNG